METSFFTGFGHLCRFLAMGVIAIFFINATLHETPITISSKSSAGAKMVQFKGETNKAKKIVLKWKLSNSESFSYVVEKSRDGENFAEVDTKNIQSGPSGELSWTDAYPKTVNCYRLRMTDEKGQIFYSKVLVVQMFKTGQVSLVSATPDLVVNNIVVDVELKERAVVTMNILDKAGNIVLQQKQGAEAGSEQYSIRGSNELKPGDYYLNVIVNGEEKMMVHLVKS
ncbi:MAG TPA: hypothetical protein VLA58_03845 [Chitinophagaceae bacterium]|nr:hypothetical protein [Chitinophagaceae bacterium]